MRNDVLIASRSQEDFALFRARFLRCYPLLRFVARRVLGGSEQADSAVENSWFRASRNPPHFEYESEFRSWLVRVLIDEALLILRQNQRNARNRIVLRRDCFGARNQLREKQAALPNAAGKGEY
jgi:DNA-directed RNA polymerase specialized sigma24 family protein